MYIDNEILKNELFCKEMQRGELLTKYKLIHTLFLKRGQALIVNQLKAEGYASIAVYGAGIVGKALFDVLNKNFDKVHVIDQNNSSKYDFDASEVYKAEDFKLEIPDCVIVTPTSAYEAIKVALMEKGFKEIYSLAEIVRLPEMGREI